MSKVRTIEEFLTGLIVKKESVPICNGYIIQHDPAKMELTIGRGVYNLSCPKCGFGQGGSLHPEDAIRLRALQAEQPLTLELTVKIQGPPASGKSKLLHEIKGLLIERGYKVHPGLRDHEARVLMEVKHYKSNDNGS